MNSNQVKKIKRRKKIRTQNGYSPNLNKNIVNNNRISIQYTTNQQVQNVDQDKYLEEKKIERKANSIKYKEHYSFKDIINLDLNEYQFRKVFHNGEMVYQITDQSVIIKIKSGNWYGNTKRKSKLDTKNNVVENIATNKHLHEPVIKNEEQKDSSFDENISNDNTNNEKIESLDNDSIAEYEYSEEEKLNYKIYKEYNDGTIVDFKKQFNDYQNYPNKKDFKNWNKHIWKHEDITYKISNISYYSEVEYYGLLNNFNLDIYPGDRIALIALDGVSEIVLLEILKNNISPIGGKIFFNMKREQKWFDIHDENFISSDEYKTKFESKYSFQSPNYLLMINSKVKTWSLILKALFQNEKELNSNKLYNDLLYLLDISNYLNVNINNLNDLITSRFIFMCDILIGKKVIVMKDIVDGFNINQKINFYRYMNMLFDNTETIIFFNAKDPFDIKLFANRLVMINNGTSLVDKRLFEIINTCDTLDQFIVDSLESENK